MFGFLGPNGAGKTTTIRLLMGLIHATRGSARIFGLDCDRDSVAVKRKVGYCPGELPQFGGWRGSEIVAYVSGLRGDVHDAAIMALAERLDLDLGRKYREYSHGNKQKLALVLAFMHEPALVILDEPTSGLDPLHQQEFYGIVRDARARGATIFISSHVLSEVEQVCDRVGIVREGRLATVSALEDLDRDACVPDRDRLRRRGAGRPSAVGRRPRPAGDRGSPRDGPAARHVRAAHGRDRRHTRDRLHQPRAEPRRDLPDLLP